MMERARFLDHSEESFYAALLACDGEFYSRVADEIRREIETLRAEQVLCDAVEFYNPLHDMALPLVLAALAGRNDVAVFEMPIVFQRPGPGEVYEVQRFPDGSAHEQIVLELTNQELTAKLRARDEIYVQTCRQLGPLVDIAGAHAAVEVVRPSTGAVPAPDGAARVLRYERRGRRLQQEGAVAQVITYADHYAPLTRRLGVH